MNFSTLCSDFRTIAVLAVCGCGVMSELRADDLKIEMSAMLPPFIVERSVGPPWKFAKTTRFEILSRCNEATTEKLAMAFHRSSQLLDMVLPPRFQLTLDVPQTLIFYDEKLWPVTEQNAVAELIAANPPARQRGARAEGIGGAFQIEPIAGMRATGISPKLESGHSFFSNLMLTDADSIFVFALVSNRMIDPKESFLTPAYVRTLLNSRVPILPEWFQKGFMGMYYKMDIRRNTVRTKPTRSFLTSEESAGLKTSLSFLLLDGRPSIENANAWSTQCELFVSWGIDPQNRSVAEFWNFVERACSETVTETLFETCLGMSFAAAEQQIDAYAATTGGIRWRASKEVLRVPDLVLQDALPNDIARIKGEWERLEARYVRKNRSEFESQYVDLSRRTFKRAIERGDRDPRLLASFGLLELDAGDDAAAIPLLEEAAHQEVVRPRAYYELARLRYEQLEVSSEINDGKYPKEQSDYMLKMLLAAVHQSPPLLPVFELLEHVSSNSLESPSAEVLAAIERGARLFHNREPSSHPFFERIESPQIPSPIANDR